MAEKGGPCETPWCTLSVARYAVAFLVDVVAVAVVAKTISTVLRPRQFELVISEGYVWVDKFPVLPPRGANLTLWFYPVAYNPTIYDLTYSKIRVQLLDIASSPPADVISFDVSEQFHLESLAWVTFEGWETFVSFEQMPARYLSKIYDSGFVEVAMRVQGMLTKSPQSPAKANSTSSVVYYCWPVVLGFQDYISRNDVSCPQVDH